MLLTSLLLLFPAFACAAAVSELLHEQVNTLGGDPLGKLDELIVDVRAGRLIGLPVTNPGDGRFPPLTQWQVEHPSAEVSERQGFVRREPSDERRRLHDHGWDRQW